jgi:predicted O-linked N-acetylglucosamine transferase (SPINDLY family)
MTTSGLVGVCKTEPEVLEHIDEALFTRIGLPEWLIAKSVDGYVQAAVRLIMDDTLRLSLRRDLIARKATDELYRGQPELFAEQLLALA